MANNRKGQRPAASGTQKAPSPSTPPSRTPPVRTLAPSDVLSGRSTSAATLVGQTPASELKPKSPTVTRARSTPAATIAVSKTPISSTASSAISTATSALGATSEGIQALSTPPAAATIAASSNSALSAASSAATSATIASGSLASSGIASGNIASNIIASSGLTAANSLPESAASATIASAGAATARSAATAQSLSETHLSGPGPAAPKRVHSSAGRAWTPVRSKMLRDMWDSGSSASDVAKALGDVDRATVVSKVYSLGLTVRPEQLGRDAHERFPGLEFARDPILAIFGKSVRAADLLALQYAKGKYYLDEEMRRMVRDAIRIAMRVASDGPPQVTGADLLSALLEDPHRKSSPRWTRRHYELLGPRPIKPFSAKDDAARGRVAPDAILRWDAVDIIATAADMRALYWQDPNALEVPLMLAGYLFSPAGQIAITDVLGDDGFERYRTFAHAVFDNYVAERDPTGPRGAAISLSGQLAVIAPFQAPRAPRAGYASDRVDLAGLDAGVARDARALADLILLEAAAPPLAIGVFGSWGSGKSTLLAALKQEIAQQAAEERDRISAGADDEDVDTRRVAGVLQIELNAWSFADSDNLWASLTSDIFEQIAAGGKNQAKAAAGAKLVAEVAERTHKEAAVLRDAQAQRHEAELQREAADKAIAEAERDAQLKPIDAALAVLVDFFVEQEDKDETKSGDAGKADAGEKQEAPPSALDQFRDAALLSSGDPAEKIRKYLDAGNSAFRLAYTAWDYACGRGLARSGLVLLGALALGAAIFFGARALLPIALPWLRTGVASLGAAVGLLIAVGRYIAPAIRGAALVREKLQIKEKAAAERKLFASSERRAADAAIEKAKVAEARGLAYMEKYGAVEGPGASPALMLGYLLEDSAEIDLLRGSLGTLGTVRKAFERLDTLVEEQSADRSAAVQRIVITIDDLDRCSERQVVQILEAIHLLLAFPCFVVVVAVDARWLETALAAEHNQLKPRDGAAGSAAETTVTPADYLEKIFQVAYWVRPLRADTRAIDGGSYGRLIDELTGTSTNDAPVFTLPAQEGLIAGPGSEPIVDGLTPIEPFAPEQPVAPERERLRFGDAERELFKKLGPLAARSPRAVKRMVNVYRLIRVASETIDGRLVVIGPDSERVLALLVQFALACEAGFPAQQYGEIARKIERLGEFDWKRWRQAIEETLPSPLASSDAMLPPKVDFDIFFTALRDTQYLLRTDIEHRDLQRAFALAGRFSFRKPPQPQNEPEN